MSRLHTLLLVGLIGPLMSGCQSPDVQTPEETLKPLQQILSTDWIVLRRPVNGWELGNLVDLQSPSLTTGDIQPVGHINTLCDFAGLDIPWPAPAQLEGRASYIGETQYQVDFRGLFAPLGNRALEAAIHAANTKERVANIRRSKEHYVSPIDIVTWARSPSPDGSSLNYFRLSNACRAVLVGGRLRPVGGLFIMEEGEIYAVDRFGNPDRPLFSAETGAQLSELGEISAGLDGTRLRRGEIATDSDSGGLVLAIRELDVYRYLLEVPEIRDDLQGRFFFGALGRDITPEPLSTILINAGLAFPWVPSD